MGTICPNCDEPADLRCCQDCREESCEGCDVWTEADEGGWLCEECADNRRSARESRAQRDAWYRLTLAQRDARIRDAKP